MTEKVKVFAVIVEEFDSPPPYGDGKLINRECAIATLDHDEAREVYDSHVEFWADKSRFHVVWHTEFVKPEMARMLRGAKETA